MCTWEICIYRWIHLQFVVVRVRAPTNLNPNPNPNNNNNNNTAILVSDVYL